MTFHLRDDFGSLYARDYRRPCDALRAARALAKAWDRRIVVTGAGKHEWTVTTKGVVTKSVREGWGEGVAAVAEEAPVPPETLEYIESLEQSRQIYMHDADRHRDEKWRAYADLHRASKSRATDAALLASRIRWLALWTAMAVLSEGIGAVLAIGPKVDSRAPIFVLVGMVLQAVTVACFAGGMARRMEAKGINKL